MRTLFALVFLTACGTNFIDANNDGIDDREPGQTTPSGEPLATPTAGTTTAAPSALSIDEPTAAAYLAPGTTTVTGRATGLTQVTVNGADASVANDRYSFSAPLALGMNVFEVIGEDAEGNQSRDVRAALSGEFAAPDGFVDSGVQLHLGSAVLDSLTPMIGDLLDPAALSTQITALNPVMDDGTMVVNALGLNFSGTDVTAVALDGALALTITVHDFHIPLDITGAPLGVDAGDITAEQLILNVDVSLNASNGELEFGLVGGSSQFVEFDFEVNNWLANIFTSADDVEVEMYTALESLYPLIPGMADELLAGLDLNTELDLLGQSLVVAPEFSAAGIQADGIYLGVDLALDVTGANPSGPGHLSVGPAPRRSAPGAMLQVQDDLLNRLLHELWAAGVVDVELPVAPTDAAALLVTLVGGEEGVEGSLGLQPNLPPVLVEVNGETRMQMGEIALTIGTPGGEHGDTVEFMMALDAKADLLLSGSAVGFELSDPNIVVVPVGASDTPAIRDTVDGVQASLRLGIGAINDLLSFPLPAPTDGSAPLEIPPVLMARDASTLSTNVEIELADILGLIGGLTGMPVEPPANPTVPPTGPTVPPSVPPSTPVPNGPPAAGESWDVAIPSDVSFTDDDVTLADDNGNGWLCRNNDIELTGANGVWYVERNVELTVTGSGHTIYAVNNADLILNGSGNTVYADDGADIEDNGTNTIVLYDPLTLDEDLAPEDGC